MDPDEAFDLLKVVDVVAGHGFYDGPKGHGAALGVGCEAMPVILRDGGEEEQVPVAGGLEESEAGLEVAVEASRHDVDGLLKALLEDASGTDPPFGG